MIITIDGPAGTGKTTVARTVAHRLNFPYFDTGAMYRCVTWKLLHDGVDWEDGDALDKALSEFLFKVENAHGVKRYFVDGVDVTDQIREKEVTSKVSAVSALPKVREKLWALQRDFGKQGNAVFEGRDMGTVVFPHADIKIFLTAKPEIRAKRRLDEVLSKQGRVASLEESQRMLEEIIRRDTLDSSREIAPLKKAEDAYEIDTSGYTIEEVVELILKYKKSKQS